MKNALSPATTLHGSVSLPFVISTGEVMGCGPPKVMKIGLGPAIALLGSVTRPFVIPFPNKFVISTEA
jgi:hypothetical protein